MKKLVEIIKKLGILIIMLTFILPVTVYAQENTASIHITELALGNEAPVAGVELTLYQVAAKDTSETEGYTFTEVFSKADISLEEVHNTNKYKEVMNRIDQFIQDENPEGEEKKVTDNDGKVSFMNLQDGIYFVKQTNTAEDFDRLGYTVSTDSYLIELPWMDESGTLLRTVYCKPKCTVQYPSKDTTDISVYKVWKDNNNEKGLRPVSIEAGLYVDHRLKEKVILSAENNWTYSWKELDSGSKLEIKELKIPEGYKSTVRKEGTVFTIENSQIEKQKGGPTGVITGDNTDITIYGILMYIAILLVVIIVLLKKKRRIV